jgi:hypothetical protein
MRTPSTRETHDEDHHDIHQATRDSVAGGQGDRIRPAQGRVGRTRGAISVGRDDTDRIPANRPDEVAAAAEAEGRALALDRAIAATLAENDGTADGASGRR